MNYTIEQLKAYAYDLIAEIEHLQNELKKTNNLIAQKSQEEPKKEEPKKEEK